MMRSVEYPVEDAVFGFLNGWRNRCVDAFAARPGLDRR
jgi:hypothetical protein